MQWVGSVSQICRDYSVGKSLHAAWWCRHILSRLVLSKAPFQSLLQPCCCGWLWVPWPLPAAFAAYTLSGDQVLDSVDEGWSMYWCISVKAFSIPMSLQEGLDSCPRHTSGSYGPTSDTRWSQVCFLFFWCMSPKNGRLKFAEPHSCPRFCRALPNHNIIWSGLALCDAQAVDFVTCSNVAEADHKSCC